MTDKKYDSENIKVLEGLEAVRVRPAMYVGSTGKTGLHHLAYEVVDNSVDEAMGGFCTVIFVILNKNGSVTVSDNGRGIPVELHPIYKKSALEIVVTKLHAGGKFDKGSYAVSGGLHGVGISVVAALSKHMKVTVKRGGKIYQQEYKIGKPLYDVKVVGNVDKSETGTEVNFLPDDSIFSTIQFDFSVLQTRFREIAFLNKGLKIVLEEEGGKKEVYNYEGGVVEFVKWLNKSKEALHKPIYYLKEDEKVVVECAVQYNASYQENVLGFVNTINTVEGGTHVVGFKTALTRAINDYANKNKLLKDGNLTGDDVREGLTAVISIKVPEPQFEGQTKTKLGNSEVKGIVDKISHMALSEFFEENPPLARKIINKALEAQKARSAARKAKELVRRKSAFGGGGLPGKLADCSDKKSENTEVFIVEGDSAGGCFSGDTQVALADGRNLSFIELIKEQYDGKEHFCYTIKDNGSVGIERIRNIRLTKNEVSVIKVFLDNNQEIICTPEHKFMLRDGSYKEAQYLTKEDSLMPLHKRLSKIGGRITIDGYEMIWDQNKTWVFTHLLADEYNLIKGAYAKEQGDHRHHIDFNKLNNSPTNIIRMSKEEHLLLHTELLSKTIHRSDVKEKASLAHKDENYRKKMSEWAKQPMIRDMLSKRAKEQWKNEDYKRYMVQKFLAFYNSDEEYKIKNNEILNKSQVEYWSNLENRKKAAEKVRIFFKENPDAKEYLSKLAKEQWKDDVLLLWRRQKTREQWTPNFRKKRKESYNKTYYNKTISLMKKVFETRGDLGEFDRVRVENNDKSILSSKEFCSRFFKGNRNLMFEAINNWNHKIKRIERLKEKIDVYDLEVPYTHNFALASGIFVHNSGKQARNKEFQAILPLRGKILNVEKANPIKVLSNEEISALITAIGTGIGEQFDINNLRYSKVVIMSVDGQETTFIQTPAGEVQCVKIGDFIDNAFENTIDISTYKVLCFNLKTRRSQFKALKAVIKHPISESLYEIKTSYGRSVKVTSSHSVFVHENNEIILKKGNEIKLGDKVVAPRFLPLFSNMFSNKIDLLSLLIKNKSSIIGNIYIRGKSVEELLKYKIRKSHENDENLTCERIIIPEEIREQIKDIRENKKLSQEALCKSLGVKQPCVYYGWEKGTNKPTLKKFEKYIEVLGMNKDKVFSQVQVVKSSLDRVWDNQYKNSGRNIVKDYISLSQLEEGDLRYLGEDISICPEHYSANGIKRYIPVNNSLMKLMGFWLAEGSWSIRNGIRVSIGNNDNFLIEELSKSFEEVFGIKAKLFYSKDRENCGELKIVNKVAAILWKILFNLNISESSNKKVPSIIFNVNKELQLEFLRGYFLGDGTLSDSKILFTTVSRDLADQLIYLLQSFGVMASVSTREPGENSFIKSKHLVYTISVNSKKDILTLKRVWESHRNAEKLNVKLESGFPSVNRKFNIISDDLVGLEVKNVREVESSNSEVYDFSVEEDENFIAGFGGLCCHNTDADVDGAHIRTLLLTFFFRFMPELIKQGHIYIAVPPLYRVRKRGDHYVYSDDELKEIKQKLGQNVDVQRFKGLGEMNPEQLWDTTMNPKTRLFKKVTIEDAALADEVFSRLMGDDVEARRQFIAERAKEAEIDV